jgi:phosphopantetheine--protein transferase-like protein
LALQAKEAVIKAISNSSADSAPLFTDPAAGITGIEIVRGKSGAPMVKLIPGSYCEKVFTALGLSTLKVSISHSGEFAVAQATAGR